MNHDSVKFFFEGGFKSTGIVLHAIHADKNIAFDFWGRLVGEGNDIGKVIMTQILYIELVKVVVGAEDKRKIFQLTGVPGNDLDYPAS